MPDPRRRPATQTGGTAGRSPSRRTAPAATRHAADRRPGDESDPVQQQHMELLPTFLAYARLAAGLCPALGHLSGLRIQEHRVCRPAARNRLENRQGSERVHSARRRKRTVEVRSSPSSQPQRGGYPAESGRADPCRVRRKGTLRQVQHGRLRQSGDRPTPQRARNMACPSFEAERTSQRIRQDGAGHRIQRQYGPKPGPPPSFRNALLRPDFRSGIHHRLSDGLPQVPDLRTRKVVFQHTLPRIGDIGGRRRRLSAARIGRRRQHHHLDRYSGQNSRSAEQGEGRKPALDAVAKHGRLPYDPLGRHARQARDQVRRID